MQYFRGVKDSVLGIKPQWVSICVFTYDAKDEANILSGIKNDVIPKVKQIHDFLHLQWLRTLPTEARCVAQFSSKSAAESFPGILNDFIDKSPHVKHILNQPPVTSLGEIQIDEVGEGLLDKLKHKISPSDSVSPLPPHLHPANEANITPVPMPDPSLQSHGSLNPTISSLPESKQVPLQPKGSLETKISDKLDKDAADYPEHTGSVEHVCDMVKKSSLEQHILQ